MMAQLSIHEVDKVEVIEYNTSGHAYTVIKVYHDTYGVSRNGKFIPVKSESEVVLHHRGDGIDWEGRL